MSRILVLSVLFVWGDQNSFPKLEQLPQSFPNYTEARKPKFSHNFSLQHLNTKLGRCNPYCFYLSCLSQLRGLCLSGVLLMDLNL